jgi:DNA-binding winged helix-turn-helix (wHTH) protein/tetratricopeptide (TPR) repeat protein
MEERPDIQFDRWTFRRRPRALLRDGVRVKLQDQSLQILEALLESPGDLVTRERLIARLWPKRIVEFDAALNAAVRRLRATLCDVAETPRYVETVPRQGYRFIGAIRELCDAASASLESPRLPALPAPGPAGVAAQRPPALQRVGVPIAVGAICIALGGAALWAGLATRSQPAAVTRVAMSESVVRAKYFAQRRAQGDLERARHEYQRALSVDAKRAEAWAGLAGVHWLEISDGLRPRDANLPKVRDAAQRALAIDPDLAEAHLRLAQYLDAVGEPAAALAHKAKALELDPDNALLLGFLAACAAEAGRWDEAIVLQRRASAAEPLSLIAALNLAHFLFLAGRTDDAKAQFAKVRELDPTQPDEIGAFAQILESRYEPALGLVEAWPDSDARNHALAMIYHGLGRSKEAEEHLDRLKAAKTWDNNIRVAEVCAFIGRTDEAFRWLERSDSGSRDDAPRRLLFASPFLSSLHRDARWSRLAEVAPRERGVTR